VGWGIYTHKHVDSFEAKLIVVHEITLSSHIKKNAICVNLTKY